MHPVVRQRFLRNVVLAIAVIIAIVAAGYSWFILSPWPSVLIIRHSFDQDATKRDAALAKYVPSGIGAFYDRSYGDASDEYMDVFFPLARVEGGRLLPAVVWLHGGAFVAGKKSDVGEYLKILAARGFVTVAVDYSLAPEAQYPTPVVQANQALAFIVANAKALHIDARRIVLAGNSAGAQIAAQVAEIISSPSYSKSVNIRPGIPRNRLRGVILFCGVYDAAQFRENAQNGQFDRLISTVMWSYFGEQNVAADPRIGQFSIYRYLTPQFPATFVSAGNADPLEPQSVRMADAIAGQGVTVDTLFFPQHYTPALPHEYQFYLDLNAAREALKRVGAFVARVVDLRTAAEPAP